MVWIPLDTEHNNVSIFSLTLANMKKRSERKNNHLSPSINFHINSSEFYQKVPIQVPIFHIITFYPDLFNKQQLLEGIHTWYSTVNI